MWMLYSEIHTRLCVCILHVFVCIQCVCMFVCIQCVCVWLMWSWQCSQTRGAKHNYSPFIFFLEVSEGNTHTHTHTHTVSAFKNKLLSSASHSFNSALNFYSFICVSVIDYSLWFDCCSFFSFRADVFSNLNLTPTHIVSYWSNTFILSAYTFSFPRLFTDKHIQHFSPNKSAAI